MASVAGQASFDRSEVHRQLLVGLDRLPSGVHSFVWPPGLLISRLFHWLAWSREPWFLAGQQANCFRAALDLLELAIASFAILLQLADHTFYAFGAILFSFHLEQWVFSPLFLFSTVFHQHCLA